MARLQMENQTAVPADVHRYPTDSLNLLGWKTDWLYERLFDLARDTWREANDAAIQRGESPPDYLVATEHAAFNEQFTMAFGTAVRIWSTLDDFASLQDEAILPAANGPVDMSRSLFRIPAFAFHIRSDRKAVLVSRHLGGRYGNGGWYDVLGQGKLGRLSNSNRSLWMS